MAVRWLIILLFGISFNQLFGQTESDKIFIAYGYYVIPLHIDRTNVTRWMISPTVEGGYRLNDKLLITVSYLGLDTRVKHYSPEELDAFKEVPHLISYDDAIMYEGKKFTLSLFSDYIFAGLQYEHYKSKMLKLRFNIQLGYRFGETSVLTHVIQNPSWPNGFEVRSNNQSSTSPGIKLSISPQIVFWDLLSVEISVGSFIFTNWPVLQPFANFQLGFSF